MTEVVAALIWRGDRFLACQRPANKARGLLWEFVGGKVEPGESKEQALVRECREELEVKSAVRPMYLDHRNSRTNKKGCRITCGGLFVAVIQARGSYSYISHRPGRQQ